MADVRKLPVPVSDVWEWQIHGACRGMNSDLFFHPDRERGPSRAAREARAKQVCRGCAVIDRCRGHALAAQEPYGVWGGLSEAERNQRFRTDAVREDPAGAQETRAVPSVPLHGSTQTGPHG